MTNTSFEDSSNWYAACVKDKGHYFHRNIILPRIKQILTIHKSSKIIDLACGSGILQRWINPETEYVGLDISKSLIKEAGKYAKKNQSFIQADITKQLPVSDTDFSHAFIILALQNIEDGEKAIKNASKHLKKNGKLIMVLNHPCFRIPRQSAWHIDDEKKLQSRLISSYMSPMKIPIKTHPSKKSSAVTYSFHYPIETYINWLYSNNLLVEKIEELCSDKKSTGKKARMENRARKEFPLFMIIVAKKAG